jgi:hypothetical protein
VSSESTHITIRTAYIIRRPRDALGAVSLSIKRIATEGTNAENVMLHNVRQPFSIAATRGERLITSRIAFGLFASEPCLRTQWTRQNVDLFGTVVLVPGSAVRFFFFFFFFFFLKQTSQGSFPAKRFLQRLLLTSVLPVKLLIQYALVAS